MKGKLLLSEPHITISYDLIDDVLYADWTGDQTEQSVMNGCEHILYYLRMNHCHKVLNDNSNVTSIWDDASKWVATDWFPRMYAAGCRLFAWVYSPNLYSKLSTDKSLSYGIKGVIATTFDGEETALAWLRTLD